MSAPRANRPPTGTRMGRRRALVLFLVHLAIVGHVIHWLWVGDTLAPLEPSEAIAFSREGLLNAGALLLAGSALLTLVVGRFFCGWACHLVAIQDGCRWLLARMGLTPRPLKSTLLVWVPWIAFVYMFVWPLVYRLATNPDLETRLELSTPAFWQTFPGWGLGMLTFLLCGAGIVWFLGSKGFCRFACPYGALYGFADRFSPLRITVSEACRGCALCTAVCTSGVNVSREVRQHGHVVDSGCMKTMDCVAACPNQALSLGFARPALLRSAEPLSRRGRSVDWGSEVLLALAALASFLALRGLYGKVSFLLALGASVMAAFLMREFLFLLRRRDFRLQHWNLKKGGKITRAGRVYALVSLLTLAFMAHSGWVQWNTWRALQALDHASSGDFADPAAEEAGVRRALQLATSTAGQGLFPDHRLQTVRARALLRLGEQGLAEAAYRQARLAEPRNTGLKLEHARLLLALGRGAEAQALLRAVLEKRPQSAEARQTLGLVYLEEGRAMEARQVFEEGLRRHPDSPGWWTHTGNALSREGRLDDAVTHWTSALELQPDYRPAKIRLAEALCELQRADEGYALIRELLAEAPRDAGLHVLAAKASLALQLETQARRHADLARRFDSGHPALPQLDALLEKP